MILKAGVLISAYACEPGKGSEPGIGWNLAVNLAARVPVIVLTRANNKALIKEPLASIAPEKRPEFVYHDLGKPFLWLKRFFKAHRWYYLLWQKTAKQEVARLISARNVSILHHATYASFRYPTAVLGHGVPAVWGPVGGVEATPWNLMPWTHPLSFPYEAARNIGITRRKHFPEEHWYRYARVLAATKETRKIFATAGITADLLPAIGLDETHETTHTASLGNLRLLFVGPLHYLKGVQFAIEALTDVGGATLTVVGTGPFEPTLRGLARRLNVQNRVRFIGHVPHAELRNIYSSHDVFIFPSLHDSGGMAVLEAMSSKLAVICLDCGGPALSVSDECGFRIPLGSRRSIILGIRNALRQYRDDPSLIEKHGLTGREHARKKYSWTAKTDRLLEIYAQVLEEAPC
jgi:glycosyltransferase involved in cell wall biosynthesis